MGAALCKGKAADRRRRLLLACGDGRINKRASSCQSGTSRPWGMSPRRAARGVERGADREAERDGALLGGRIATPAPLGGVVQLGQLADLARHAVPALG